MHVVRPPDPALAPWVSCVWLTDVPAIGAAASRRERAVPSGGVHLVLRLDDTRIRIFDDLDDRLGRSFSAVIGGARSSFHVREVAPGARSIGIQLRPGAAGVVLGVRPGELAERHTALEDLWGREARVLRDRLRELRAGTAQLRLLEQAVVARLQPRFAPHPAVQHALARFGGEATGWQVAPVRRDTRLSHRRFVQLFRRDVGLGPKQLCRVLRLGHALRLATGGTRTWAEVASAAGYCDQSHLVRELRTIAGVSPTEWAALSGRHPHHIPVVNSIQDRRAALSL
jgi:AraC-like DNA-binding protein